MLVDRGELDMQAPVARYWPEFAANGKESIRVLESRLPPGVAAWHPRSARNTASVLDDRRMAALLAAQPAETDPRPPSSTTR